ncbi:ATPase [Leuconostoc gelidum subsp. gelidum]|jgi:hypothetical protein|nr:ATPase [Leuconostoc gelidum subsp. gelidum]
MTCFVEIEIVGIFPRLITNAQISALCAIKKIYSKIIHIVNYNLCNIVWQYHRRLHDNFVQKVITDKCYHWMLAHQLNEQVEISSMLLQQAEYTEKHQNLLSGGRFLKLNETTTTYFCRIPKPNTRHIIKSPKFS